MVSQYIEKPEDGIKKSEAIRAAQYVRMSTEHQKYSTENQRDLIQEYADEHGMIIVRTYADDGKSGLSIDGRNALKMLIEDVESRRADFDVILVYDISRWGRFQDADESAYYEYICKRLVSKLYIVPNRLRMMTVQYPPLSRVLSEPWQVNTVASFL